MVIDMVKDFIYRSKNAKFPNPKLVLEESDRLFLAAWAWGAKEAATKAIDIIKEYYLSARTDVEATSPFPLLPELSLAANHLRIGVMLANNILAKENNADEYTSGVEIFAANKSDRELNVIHVGGPSLYCLNATKQLIPYIKNSHLGQDFHLLNQAPLPRDFIGIHPKKHITCRSFRSRTNDKFILLQRDHGIDLGNKVVNFDSLKDRLVEDNKDLPFWLCEFSFR